LIVPKPFRTGGGLSGSRRGRGCSARGFAVTGDHDDPQDPDSEAHHEPRLSVARDHTAGRSSLIDDWRCAVNLVGHNYRPCWNENLSFPRAKYPRSITLGTTNVPLCT